MSGKSKLNWKHLILIGAIIVAGVYGIGSLTNKMNSEHFGKVWIISLKNKPTLFLYTTQSHSGKSSSISYFFRLMDPITGKVISHREIVYSSYKDLTLVCMTSKSIWIKVRADYRCYALPGFERKLNSKEFNHRILEKFPTIGKIHSIKFIETEGVFEVENDKAELTRFSPTVFDEVSEEGIDMDGKTVVNLNYYPELGDFFNYPIPTPRTQEGITITVDDFSDEVKPIFRVDEPLVEMLSHDTGFSKYYAVFTPDSTCLLMDGNKRRTMQRLSKDSIVIKRENLFGNKVWLNGDFLRPIKQHAELPKSRLVISYKQHVYVCWNSSLDEKENKVMLTAIDLHSMKETWTIDLAKNKIMGSYEPFQSHIIEQTLLTVWTKGSRFCITGINLENGELRWKFTR